MNTSEAISIAAQVFSIWPRVAGPSYELCSAPSHRYWVSSTRLAASAHRECEVVVFLRRTPPSAPRAGHFSNSFKRIASEYPAQFKPLFVQTRWLPALPTKGILRAPSQALGTGPGVAADADIVAVRHRGRGIRIPLCAARQSECKARPLRRQTGSERQRRHSCNNHSISKSIEITVLQSEHRKSSVA
jgi:hypothetical protein